MKKLKHATYISEITAYLEYLKVERTHSEKEKQ